MKGKTVGSFSTPKVWARIEKQKTKTIKSNILGLFKRGNYLRDNSKAT